MFSADGTFAHDCSRDILSCLLLSRKGGIRVHNESEFRPAVPGVLICCRGVCAVHVSALRVEADGGGYWSLSLLT